MNKQVLKTTRGDIPYLTNDSKSKKMLLYMHGLDGTAAFSKPLFKNLSEYKIVAMESRGHNNSPIKASRFIYKHVEDYMSVIEHFKAKGYKIGIIGESMGAAYATYISYKHEGLIEGIFAGSIPNKLENIMVAPKGTQFKIQAMTTLSFLTNINYKYKASVNYSLLSSNKTLHRLARMADKGKVRQVRETLATWAITKRAGKYLKSNKEVKTPLYYFQPEDDVIVDIEKAKKNLMKSNAINKKYILIPNAKHILMYEKEFDMVVSKIKMIIK